MVKKQKLKNEMNKLFYLSELKKQTIRNGVALIVITFLVIISIILGELNFFPKPISIVMPFLFLVIYFCICFMDNKIQKEINKLEKLNGK